jgi:hypothetical protein
VLVTDFPDHPKGFCYRRLELQLAGLDATPVILHVNCEVGLFNEPFNRLREGMQLRLDTAYDGFGNKLVLSVKINPEPSNHTDEREPASIAPLP